MGTWNPELAADIQKVRTFNLTANELTKDQLIQLYLILYPYIAAEFSHRDDLQAWADAFFAKLNATFEKFNGQIEAMATSIKTHEHPVAGTAAGPSTTLPSMTTPSIGGEFPVTTGFSAGQKNIVESSRYSRVIKHRNPDAPILSPVVPPAPVISEDYSLTALYKPFDVDGDDLDTGDSSFLTGGIYE